MGKSAIDSISIFNVFIAFNSPPMRIKRYIKLIIIMYSLLEVFLMGKKIAVERELSNVKRYLTGKGYDVVNLEQDSNLSGINVNDYDAIVITGQHKDMVGFENTYTKSPIIDATGMTPEDIESAIKRSTGGDTDG